MESVWTELPAVDPWETSVAVQRLLLQRLMVFSFHSGRWKECTLVRYPVDISCWKLTASASSSIIEKIEIMRKSGLASFAIFYYDFREDEKKDLRGLLSSVLFQLCHQFNSHHDILSSFYSAHYCGAQSPSDDELVQCLKDLLCLPRQAPVYLIIDALDECSNISGLSSPREELLMLLEDLVTSQLPNLRICVTS